MSEMDVTVVGMEEVEAKMRQVGDDLQGRTFKDAMHDATLVVEAAAKKKLVGYQSPSVGGVDTGRLRASITPEVRSEGPVVQGIVGSNVEYAPFVELDTRPHWPPLAALETWAKRHGTTAYIVARGIARRGTIGKHYLENALKENTDRIFNILSDAVGKIVRK